MEILSVEEAAKKIKHYLSRDTLRPYFVISDGAANFKKFFGGFEQIYISDFCVGDFFMDTDNLVEKLDALMNNALVFGLGEYIHFTAQGKSKIPDALKKNYPAMNDYLADYDFGDAELTTYFRQYKKIKLCNVDDKNFKQHVQTLATQRPYNKFETRQKILDGADPTAKLYWLDSLGVEFLSYIKARAAQAGLSATTKIDDDALALMIDLQRNFFANPSAAYKLSRPLKKILSESR